MQIIIFFNFFLNIFKILKQIGQKIEIKVTDIHVIKIINK